MTRDSPGWLVPFRNNLGMISGNPDNTKGRLRELDKHNHPRSAGVRLSERASRS
jgi:hypothetical protein